jgi:hypothetical protein
VHFENNKITGAMKFNGPTTRKNLLSPNPLLTKVAIIGKSICKHDFFLFPAPLAGQTDAPDSSPQNQNLYASRRFVKIQKKLGLRKFFNDRKDGSGPSGWPQNQKHKLALDLEGFSPSKIGALLMSPELESVSPKKTSRRNNLVENMRQCKDTFINIKEADALQSLNRKIRFMISCKALRSSV